IGNGGDLIVPHLIDKIIDQEGNEIYSPKREVIGHVVSSNTTELLKEMMGQTIISGTSRRAFRRYHRSAALRDITVGGKTGSLTGNDPPGKYSWFVGMAPLEKPEVAIAALVINNGHWRIKGSDVAKEGFTNFFKYRD
ncbi:MAG: penicillin-binding protein, partial [Nitrospirae bacterium]|nr:penicillin-binding protein [Nitrospirota bacterium]